MNEKPQPPSGLAPGTREHRFRWLTTMRGFSPAQARAEFAEYEERMNRAAWSRYRSDLAEWERQQRTMNETPPREPLHVPAGADWRKT